MAAKQRVLWTPHEGPQTVFLQSPAFECLYGGAVGGGKSQAILYNSLRQVHIPDYRGLILRKTFQELRELMDDAAAVFPDLGATWMQSEKRAKFPSGATVEFGYCVFGDTSIVMGDGSLKPMKNVSAGDMVQTLEGPRRVLRHWFAGNKPCVEIRAGESVAYASESHAMLMANGEWRTPFDVLGGLPEGDGIADTRSCEHSQGAALPPRSYARVARLSLDHLSAEAWGPDSEHLHAGENARYWSAPQGFPGDYRHELRSCGALALLEGVAVQESTRLRADAGIRVQTTQKPLGGQENTPGCTPWGASSYCHPYTKEARPICVDVRDDLVEMVRVGDLPCWDMTVEGANHYITKPGFVHKNCETYSDVLQYRGQQYQYVAYDEIGDLPDERVWTFLLTRIRSGSDPRLVKMARCTANPGGAGHGWLKRRFISVCPPDGTIYFDPETGNTRAFVQAKVKDNPTLLKNDPDYMKRLLVLSAVEREQLLEGNWDAGSGLAFETLTPTSHVVPKEPVPSWASCFGAFDWGFGHKWSFSVAYMKPTSRGAVLHVIDSASGRRQTPDVIVDRVRDLLKARGLDVSRLAYTVAGSDVKIRDEARGSYGPSVMEQFANYGWFLMNADNSRVAGYQNLLRYIDHRLIEWEDTPGNRADIAILREMAMDPDYPNDVRKVDVHPVTGEGGDDAYDKTRYLAMSRPLASVEPVEQLSRAVMRGHLPSPTPPRHVLNVEMPRMDGGYATTSTRV